MDNNDPRYQLLKYFATVQNTGKIAPDAKPFTGDGMAAKVANFVTNLPSSVVNEIIGKGLIAPTEDVTQNVKNVTTGQEMIPYADLKSGPTKIGYQLSGAADAPQTPRSYIGNTASTLLPIATAYGGSNAANAVGSPQTFAEALSQIPQSALQSGTVGAVVGGLGGLEHGGNASGKMDNSERTNLVNKLINMDPQTPAYQSDFRKIQHDQSVNENDLLVQQLLQGGEGAIAGLGTGAAIGAVAPLLQYGITTGADSARQSLTNYVNQSPRPHEAGFVQISGSPSEGDISGQYMTDSEFKAFQLMNQGKTAPEMAKLGLTIGDIQKAHQRLSGLPLLADFDNAVKAHDLSLARKIATVIDQQPAGSPYAPYKGNAGHQLDTILKATSAEGQQSQRETIRRITQMENNPSPPSH